MNDIADIMARNMGYENANDYYMKTLGSHLIPYEEVTAIEFSADIDKPSRIQTKDGKWHENCFITGVEE